MMYLRVLLLSSFLFLNLFPMGKGQTPVGIGQWRDHFNYQRVHSVQDAGDAVYLASSVALAKYNKVDNSLERLTKVNALSDVGISTIRYDHSTETLVVGYDNGNLDLIKGSTTINLPAILNSDIFGDKTIYGITFHNGEAWLSCGFGIVVVDLAGEQVLDSYFIGHNSARIRINGIAFDPPTIYAASDSGLYQASMNSPNLSDFNEWDRSDSVPIEKGPYRHVRQGSDRLYLHYDDGSNDTLYYRKDGSWGTVETLNGVEINSVEVNKSRNELIVARQYAAIVFDSSNKQKVKVFKYTSTDQAPLVNHAIRRKDGPIWIGDERNGMVRALDSWTNRRIFPNGPEYNSVSHIDIKKGRVWVASGAVQGKGWHNQWFSRGVYSFKKEEWNTIDRADDPRLDTLSDIVKVAVHPEDPGKVMASSWSKGLLEFRDGELKKTYTHKNSTLEQNTAWNGFYIAVSGLTYDPDGNLWVANPYHKESLSVLTKEGDWIAYDMSPAIGDQKIMDDVIVNEVGHKWINLPRNDGILVFDDNGTLRDRSDDRLKRLTKADGKGGLPTQEVLSLVEDQDREIWIGTTQGIAVFYSPSDIFSANPTDAQRILIEQGPNTEILFETESITALTVDGDDRKWVGTKGSGAFLMGPEGMEQIHHFTKKNSPLPSNSIKDIAVNGETGEVFFGTNQGIVSYRGEATRGVASVDTVNVFPNPVKPGYTGPVAINGLAWDSDVKVTDISGNLVAELRSKGGQATWDGRNRFGERVSSGVYLLFATNPDGTQTKVGKLVFIK